MRVNSTESLVFTFWFDLLTPCESAGNWHHACKLSVGKTIDAVCCCAASYRISAERSRLYSTLQIRTAIINEKGKTRAIW